MADYTDNALAASIKALEKAVAPAVDPTDPLATEQLRLVVGFLKFLRLRLPHWQQRLQFELDHYVALAGELAPDARLVSEDVARRLDAAIEQALALRRPCAPVDDLRASTAALAAGISALPRLVAHGDAALRRRIEQKILAGSKRWVDMQRAWFVTQGFELKPHELPSLQEAFGAVPAPGPTPA
jgi:hypothetical protein